jgi:putative membrane protein
MTTLTTRLRMVHIPPQHRAYTALVALWVLSMISVPIFRWIAGDAVMPFSISLTVLTQAIAVLGVLGAAWGWRRTGFTIGSVAALGWLVEFIGSQTGFPFGSYQYTSLLQPQLLGVPLLIPFAWFMMLPPAWAVAQTQVDTQRRTAFILCSALAFTAWDFFLDPQMVGWGIWKWANPVGYFGIPWVNFLGWVLCAALITAWVRPVQLPVRPLLLIYLITWLFQTIGLAVFWGQPQPAIVGFGLMGLFVLLAFRAGWSVKP